MSARRCEVECGVFSSLKNRNRSTYVEATVSYKLVKRFDFTYVQREHNQGKQ